MPRYELSPVDEERVDAALVALMGVPRDSTIRAEHGSVFGSASEAASGTRREAGSHAGGPEALAGAVAANRRRFLETELAVGNTMLDAAATTRDPASRARRVVRAREAHDEVARHLADDAGPGGAAAAREDLAAGLAALRSRLADAE